MVATLQTEVVCVTGLPARTAKRSCRLFFVGLSFYRSPAEIEAHTGVAGAAVRYQIKSDRQSILTRHKRNLPILKFLRSATEPFPPHLDTHRIRPGICLALWANKPAARVEMAARPALSG